MEPVGDLSGTGGFLEVVMVIFLGSCGLKVTVNSRTYDLPTYQRLYWLSICMVASVRYLKQLIMQTVHILQLDSAVTDSPPKGGFLHGNPNLLPNNLARQ